jgi:hypothetical protein
MAHFAELDENNIVKRVLVVDNAVITREDGKEYEEDGVNYLRGIFGSSTLWKQTSYNENFRVNYAGKGMGYDSVNDMFYITECPFPSWTYNGETGRHDPPVERPICPDDRPCKVDWNESTETWDVIDL